MCEFFFALNANFLHKRRNTKFYWEEKRNEKNWEHCSTLLSEWIWKLSIISCLNKVGGVALLYFYVNFEWEIRDFLRVFLDDLLTLISSRNFLRFLAEEVENYKFELTNNHHTFHHTKKTDHRWNYEWSRIGSSDVARGGAAVVYCTPSFFGKMLENPNFFKNLQPLKVKLRRSSIQDGGGWASFIFILICA